MTRRHGASTLLLRLLFVFSSTIFSSIADRAHFRNYSEYISGGPAPIQRYKSSNVDSPVFNIQYWNEDAIDLESPYLFFSVGDGASAGPYIFSSKDLSLVYADRTWVASTNARVQQWKGETYYTFWEGDAGKGHAEGICHMLNSKYEQVRAFKSQKIHAKTDLHECRLTEWGTALITVYESTPFDLSAMEGGPVDGLMKDSCFEELDIETGEMLFQWRASDHIPYTESYTDYEFAKPGWDPYHINSIQKDIDGNYYVSLRHLHAMVKLDGKTGERIWQLGGKLNNFTDLSDGHATDFAWQHHIQLFENETILTMFDNHNLHAEREVNCIGTICSRASKIRIDHEKFTAELLQNFYAPMGVVAFAMGSYDTLPNENVLVGWGGAEITEFSPDGVPVMNIQFGEVGSWRRTYRVFKGHWKGEPTWPPDLAVLTDEESRERMVYTSWNGATEVKDWVLVQASARAQLEALEGELECEHYAKKGFETAHVWKHKSDDDRDSSPEKGFMRVVAVDKNGVVLGATGIVRMGDLRNVMPVDQPLAIVRYNRSARTFTRSSDPDSTDSSTPPKSTHPSIKDLARPGDDPNVETGDPTQQSHAIDDVDHPDEEPAEEADDPPEG